MARGAKGKKAETLTGVLSRFLEKELLPDLRARAAAPAVADAIARRFRHEASLHRTAQTPEAYGEALLEQVGAAWILSCVFVRTLEERGLAPRRRLAGEGALDSEQYFFEIAPELGIRDYLLTTFRELARFPAAGDLLGPAKNPAWRLSPSEDVARRLLDLFRETGNALADDALASSRSPFSPSPGSLSPGGRGPGGGAPRPEEGEASGKRAKASLGAEGAAAGQGEGEPTPGAPLRFRFDASGTRELGDLYQDLSASVRERYALLQTPDFVERFILSLTLDPALREFGLEGLRLLDPTCGSGHFLLGAYDRLFEARCAAEPGGERRQHALAALGQVYGVDMNPYAVAIARFRLTLSYAEKAGVRSIAEVPALPLHLVVADSLLHGAKGTSGRLATLAEDRTGWGDELFTLDDEEGACTLLGQGYHVVVGNPPYITCKDAALRETYRELYPRSAAGKYALAAPFTERFFDLAVEQGFVGLINANSFMKREFGKKLVEAVLPRLDLTHVIDTSGAYIPGHGTPTVILAGRKREPTTPTLRAVLGKRGEPSTPEEPEKGKVWSSIAAHLGEPGFDGEFVSVVEMERERLAKHPWSLGGGGASELKMLLEERGGQRLSSVGTIGVFGMTNADDCLLMPADCWLRTRVEPAFVRPIGIGEEIRDWSCGFGVAALYPYDWPATLVEEDSRPGLFRYLWPFRTLMAARATFGGGTYASDGLPWWKWHQVTEDRIGGFLIAFAFVATHNHFVLDRGGKVFNRTAPIIKLPEGATVEEHLALLGYLNSSTAGFWVRTTLFSRGAGKLGEGGRATANAWEDFLEYAGTQLGHIPIPASKDFAAISNTIAQLAERREASMPPAVIASDPTSSGALKEGRELAENLVGRMCALQEELDWQVYDAFGLLTHEDQQFLAATKPRGELSLSPGHRPFEVVLARECALTGTKTAWFQRNGYRSPDEIASTYPADVQRYIAARVEIIDRNHEIGLIERPEYKRRWTLRDYAAETRTAGADFLAEAIEKASAAAHHVRTARELASQVLADGKAREVASILFGPDADPVLSLAALALGEAVPHLAALRFTPDGMTKRAAWERTWALQRQEDAAAAGRGEAPPAIPVPPKYDRTDYRDEAFWRLRGKLDVPKERFISYPGAEREGEGPLIGWAGWDHLQRAQALAALYNERRHTDGWPKEKLVPLLAGLHELLPWLLQWHDEPSAEHGGERLGSYFARYMDEEARALGLTLADLAAWRPAPPAARRRGRKKTPADEIASPGAPSEGDSAGGTAEGDT